MFTFVCRLYVIAVGIDAYHCFCCFVNQVLRNYGEWSGLGTHNSALKQKYSCNELVDVWRFKNDIHDDIIGNSKKDQIF